MSERPLQFTASDSTDSLCRCSDANYYAYHPLQRGDHTWTAHQIVSQALSTHNGLVSSVTVAGHFPASPCLIPHQLKDN